MTTYLLLGIFLFAAAALVIGLNIWEYGQARRYMEDVEAPILHSWIHVPTLCFGGAAMCFSAHPESLVLIVPVVLGVGFLLHSILLNLEVLLSRGN